MAVSAPGDSPIDSAWRTRIPQGWIQFGDGSFGPPNSPPGSDWNAPYRTANGINPPSPSQLGRSPVGPGLGYPAVGVAPSPGAGGGVQVPPNLVGGGQSPPGATLNTTGPDVIPPQNPTIPTNKSVGPFTGGTATDNEWDPRNWFKGGQTFTPGQPIDGAAENPLSLVGKGNPYWRGAIAAGGVLTPSPAETGEFNPAMITGRPDAPMGGVHGLPAPPAVPYPPPRPVGLGAAPKKGRIAPGSVNLGRGVPGAAQTAPPPVAAPGWGMIDRPNASASGGGRGNPGDPKMGVFDFSTLFNHPAVAAAAAAHPAVQAHVAARAAPMAIGSPAPAIPPPKPRPRSSTTSQGGGY